MPRSFLLILLGALLPAPPAGAQDAALEMALPDTIVVTASRQAEDVRRTGRRVTVWTAREIARLPVTSFDELLRTVGGLEVQSRGGFGVQSDLTIRGSSFNGVLVLLDGARFNDPMTGHFLADFPVPLSEIARIEVLRGPASALYGPDALGGVIQIFTYTGLQATALPSPVRMLSAEAQYGAYDLTRLDAAARAGTGASAFSGAAAYASSDGMRILNAAGQPVVGPDGDVRTDFSRQAYTAGLGRRLGDVSLFARAGLDDRDFGAYHFYTAFPSDTAREATATYWAQVRLQNDEAATPWQVSLAARQHEDAYVYNPQTPANVHTSRLLTGHAQASHTLRAGVVLTGGLAASLRAIDSNNLGRHDDASAGLYGLARLQPLDRLTVNAGGRLDYDPGYGVEATPQVSAAYTRTHLTLRAAGGRAVRAPNYIERYFNTTLPSPRGRNLGNPDLLPEHAWSYEAGIDVYPLHGLSLHATAFLRDTDNLIDYVRLTPADTVWLARNLLSVRTRGLELDAEAHRYLGPHRLHLAASYAWLDADLGAVTDGVEYKYALTHARHLLQGTATVDVHALQLGLQGLWKEPLAGASYGVVNARLAYAFTLGRQHLVLSAEVRNLFDVSYSEVFDAPMPRRWWLAGLRWTR